MQKSAFNTLLELPLFLGMGRNDMEDIVSKVKFNFQKRYSGTLIYPRNAINHSILFLIDGEMLASRPSNNNAIRFIETIKTPNIIGAHVLFGITQAFNHDFFAKTDIQYLTIEKEAVINQLLNYPIFRLNLLNYLSLATQRRNHLLWEQLPNDITKRFVQALSHNFTLQVGEKLIQAKQEDLAKQIDVTKRNFCHMLHILEQKKLLTLGRGRINIPCFEKLIQDIL